MDNAMKKEYKGENSLMSMMEQNNKNYETILKKYIYN